MAHPKVSIIVPLYNKAPYITKALESIASQTYQDWECIIVNDGSTDDSLLKIEDFRLKNEDSRFIVINQENAGVSVARNRGIEESKGEYVCFLDADDWWSPTFLEEMVQFAGEFPDAGIYASNYIYYKPGKMRVGVKNIETGYINYPKSYYENKGQVVWTGATMLRKSIIEKREMRNEKGETFPVGITLGEDFLLWARIAMRYPVVFLSKPLAYYNNDVPAKLRLTQNLHKPEAHMLWHFDEIEDCRLEIEDCELKKDWKKLFDWLRVSGLMVYWMSDEYHPAAAKELEKVAGELPKAYKLPIWWLRAQKNIKCIGSYCKQLIIRK